MTTSCQMECPHDASGITHQKECDQPLPAPAGDVGSRTSVTHKTTYVCERKIKNKDELRTDESKIESDIREKLRNAYPEHTPPYHQLLVE